MPWTGGYAALSSFGFGGSNVHLVMHGKAAARQPAGTMIAMTAEDASLSPRVAEAPLTRPETIPLAARTPEGLEAMKAALQVTF